MQKFLVAEENLITIFFMPRLFSWNNILNRMKGNILHTEKVLDIINLYNEKVLVTNFLC